MTIRKRKEQTPQPVEGEALLEKIKSDEIKNLTLANAAIACGYWGFRKDSKGEQYKVARTDRFNSAIATAATGVNFLKRRTRRGEPKKPRNQLKVTSIMKVCVGEPYLKQLNLRINDKVSINVDTKKNQIIIEPICKDIIGPAILP
jgi:hypothetical protein